VNVIGDPSPLERAKTGCGDLQALVDEFGAFEGIDTSGYRSFKSAVLEKLGVGELMVHVGNLANESLEKQRATFRVGESGSWVPRIGEMMAKISEMLSAEDGKVSRALLTRAYRILGNLLLYVNCVSESDLGREQITAMNALSKQLAALEGAKLDVSDMEVLVAWKGDVETALAREKARPGDVKKADYERLLTKLKKSF
jgi:hypothetical protein